MALIAAWSKKYRNLDLRDEDAMIAALLFLRNRIEKLASKYIKQFYRIGRNKRRLDVADAIVVATLLQRNSTFVDGSLIPYMRNELLEPGGGTVGDLINERLGAWESRAGLYAGAGWSARWTGLQESYREAALGREVPQRVRRVLDPLAAHCPTCPPKAHEYASWDDMIAYCGGLPADGSDQCYSNCRCTVEVEVESGVWEQVI